MRQRKQYCWTSWGAVQYFCSRLDNHVPVDKGSCDDRQKIAAYPHGASVTWMPPSRFIGTCWGWKYWNARYRRAGRIWHFWAVPNSEELIELCSFPASGPVKVQEDLVHLAFEVENLDQVMDQLKAKHVPITDGPTRTSSGSRFIFIDAPGRHM